MKILICGDSYCLPDSEFPNLHWAEKLAGLSEHIEIWNLAYGGCSNALITLQLLQGLALKPDFVIVSFTSEFRYESDANTNAVPYELGPDSISLYIKERYQRNPNFKMITELSPNFEKIKNYFYIMLCLKTLKDSGINFCFTLGGFEYKQDYTALLKSNFIKNEVVNYTDHELSMNLWYHGQLASPTFHVDKDEVHNFFANECFSYLNKIHA